MTTEGAEDAEDAEGSENNPTAKNVLKDFPERLQSAILPDMQTKITFEDETYAIRGAIFTVYKTLGSGFLEEVYQKALEVEFRHCGIPFEAQKEMHVVYRGFDCGLYIPDFVCYNKIIVEIKSVEGLNGRHEAQIVNYLHATNYQVGLLANFGSHPKVDIRRFVNLHHN